MIAMTADATYNGGPLNVLADLIEKRQRVLGETCEDAVSATGINVLKSLRAETKVAPKNARKSEYAFVRDYAKAPYLTKKNRANPYGTGLLRRWRFTRLPGTSGEKSRIVYPYTARHLGNRGRMVGGSRTDELNEVLRKFGMKPIRHRNLAKLALGVAMSRISTLNTPGAGASAKTSRIADANVSVRKTAAGNVFTLEIHDRLAYAVPALKRGYGAIDAALQSAANKTAHIINNVAGLPLDQRIPTPFPEVKNRKVA